MNHFKKSLIAVFPIAIGIAIGSILFMESCKKENIESTISPSKGVPLKGVPDCKAMVEDGILHFDTYEDLSKYQKFVNQINTGELGKLEEMNKYSSYYSEINSLINEFDELLFNKNITEIAKFRKKIRSI